MKKLIILMTLILSFNSHGIVNGEIVDSPVFRQSVALVFKRDNLDIDGEIYCSGTLIGPKAIITAAHCFRTGALSFNVSLEDYQNQTWIYFGETHEERNLPFIKPQFKAKNVFLHPRNDSIHADIAIVELAENVDLDLFQITPIRYEIPTYELINTLDLIHVGYGVTIPGGKKGLKALLQLPITRFNGYNGIQVGYPQVEGPGACNGDSGGSGFLLKKSGEIRFIGVEYSISNKPCGKNASYFVPLSERIINFVKSTNVELF